MLLRDWVYSHGIPRTLRGARAPRVSRGQRVSGRVRAVSGGLRGPSGPGDASDDEEPDRFGFYDHDVNPERTREVVRALNGAYRINSSPMTGQMLSDLLVDKWGKLYPVEICIGEDWQVYLQIEPRPFSDADAKNKANILEGIGALLTEWGVADAAWRAIAKHPAKRVGAAGLLIPLPVHYYPGRGAKSVAGSRDDEDTNGSVGDDRGPARDLMPPSDSWSVFDQQESESSGDPPA